MTSMKPLPVAVSRSWLGATVFASVALGFAVIGSGAEVGSDAGGGAFNLVVGLANSSDLEPVRTAAERGGESRPAATSAGSARQSVPALNRSESYQGEIFRNTKIVVPLLVADLELRALSGVRPMSGRSVGATPSAHWTRSPFSPVIESAATGSPR